MGLEVRWWECGVDPEAGCCGGAGLLRGRLRRMGECGYEGYSRWLVAGGGASCRALPERRSRSATKDGARGVSAVRSASTAHGVCGPLCRNDEVVPLRKTGERCGLLLELLRPHSESADHYAGTMKSFCCGEGEAKGKRKPLPVESAGRGLHQWSEIRPQGPGENRVADDGMMAGIARGGITRSRRGREKSWLVLSFQFSGKGGGTSPVIGGTAPDW